MSLTADQQQRLKSAQARLAAGEPLPYILGHWEFFGLDFKVTPAVLIPRPETELLVEQALAWLSEHPMQRLAVDLGTGSGCIAISLAVHVSDLRLLAIDRSWEALEVARFNAGRHSVRERIDFIQADLLSPIRFQAPGCNLFIANLPYIPTDTLHTLDVYGKEPELALDGGPDGLEIIRRLLSQAPLGMASTGLALLEIEHRQGVQAQALAENAFPSGEVSILKDLAGLDRVIKNKTVSIIIPP